MNEEQLICEIERTKEIIKTYKDTLKYMPKNSILGRLSVEHFLKVEQRKLLNYESQLNND